MPNPLALPANIIPAKTEIQIESLQTVNIIVTVKISKNITASLFSKLLF